MSKIAMERALFIATTALVRISLEHFEQRMGGSGLLEIETPRDVADKALTAINAINQGRA